MQNAKHSEKGRIADPIDRKVEFMNIAVPVNSLSTFYHPNPFTAPKFAIYSVVGDRTNMTIALKSVIDNPLSKTYRGDFEKSQIACNCDTTKCADKQHISEHYTLLEAIGECTYLLVDHHCDNITRALRQGGVQVYKIPPIINKVDTAVKNFLLGASLASTFKHIHYAS